MLEALFNKGADPNQRLTASLLWPKSLTPWETALVRIAVAFSDGSGYDRDQLSNISECSRLMIDHGAKVDWPSVNSAMSVFQPPLESRVKESIYKAVKRMNHSKGEILHVGFPYFIQDQSYPELLRVDKGIGAVIRLS